MIYYVLGLFSGAFFAIFFLGIFMVRHRDVNDDGWL